ncbi:hypothetical protein, conserved [Plasmodium gonderi]|uniref:Uncharacterized protein n=1 Tax=Plasmodium gonderi TaxID=77519 RepID=A0A1Y1JHU4_PLAGO|nr:hypothetical protein, conserved [Plasmodium gonderi]GAW80915.1 hypothetical protein, conserved [Plasmodium gonderi]
MNEFIYKEETHNMDLRKDMENVLVLFGFITEVILLDNHILESVSINDIYRTVYSILRYRYKTILDDLTLSEGKMRGYVTPPPRENTPESKIQTQKTNVTYLEECCVHRQDDKTIGDKNIDGKIPLGELIKLKFSEIFLFPKKKKTELLHINKLNSIKYAIAGCIYLHAKIWVRNISLRNILNAIDYNIFLLNKGFYIIKYDSSKRDIEKLTDSINQFKPTTKENIYYEKEESLKMEKISLNVLSFNLTSSITKYSLLYELMFITRSPFIINKFLLSVFNDVICIPDIDNKYNDVVIVISCILFVNHFFYHINHCDNLNSLELDMIKKIYYFQVEKIINLFLLLNRGNLKSGMKNIISLTKKISHLYSVTH